VISRLRVLLVHLDQGVMMSKSIRLASSFEKVQKLKMVLVIVLGVYSAVTTLCLVKVKPKTILIGIENNATRIIGSNDDRLLRLEKQAFLKQFIRTLYNYDESSYKEKVSLAGDLMSDQLWKGEKPKFEEISKKLEGKEITQEVRILDLREIDLDQYEADLELKVKDRLTEVTPKIKVKITINEHRRSDLNPYPYEVEHYDEQNI